MKSTLKLFLISIVISHQVLMPAMVSAGQSDNVDIRVTVLDTLPQGTIVINNGDAYTTSSSVELTLYAWDEESIVQEMRFSNDGTSWSTPEPYATTKSWVVTSGYGEKTVYVRFKDLTGNWSDAFSDIIIFSDRVTTTFTYSYDALNRLQGMAYDGKSTTYTYDEVGNIINRTTQ